MSVLDIVLRTGERHFECRSCGTNLSKGDTECPECGGDVAEYNLAE